MSLEAERGGVSKQTLQTVFTPGDGFILSPKHIWSGQRARHWAKQVDVAAIIKLAPVKL